MRFKGFVPIPGATGFQVGNPCALAICPLLASLEVFALTSMPALRAKSVELTKYLEELLLADSSDENVDGALELYQVITPSDAAQRGAQLSIRLREGLLGGVMGELEEQGVVVDERKPDVIRVAPAPLYNTFVDVWTFVNIFKEACLKAYKGQSLPGDVSIGLAGGEDRGWSQIK